MFRGQIGLSLCFLEKCGRATSAICLSAHCALGICQRAHHRQLLRTLFGMLVAAGIAYLLHRYALFDMGPALVAFFAY